MSRAGVNQGDRRKHQQPVAYALGLILQLATVQGITTKMLPSKKPKICKWCGGDNHTAWSCYKRPSGKLKKESKKHFDKRIATRKLWFELNPSDEYGYWYCYLEIAPDCPHQVRPPTLEHVKSKVRYPELQFDVTNIKAACDRCNYIKGSLDLEDLVDEYPQLKKYLVSK